jgi:hypothetical protein
MTKIDFKRERRWLYAPTSKGFSIVDVPPMPFLMIDGSGDPNTSQEYVDAIEALYAVAYTVKFSSKKELGKDYVVPPLEGLWSADDPSAFRRRAKHEWHWTMMIMQPDWITPEIITTSIEATRRKKSLPALPLLRHERFDEGRSVQIMHLGSYDAEGPVLAQLHDDYLPSHGLMPSGRHHEIYLTDARKTAPDKLKTILRQPVRQLGDEVQPG